MIALVYVVKWAHAFGQQNIEQNEPDWGSLLQFGNGNDVDTSSFVNASVFLVMMSMQLASFFVNYQVVFCCTEYSKD